MNAATRTWRHLTYFYNGFKIFLLGRGDEFNGRSQDTTGNGGSAGV